MEEFEVDLRNLRELTTRLTENGYLVDRAAQWEFAFDAVKDLVMIVNPSLNIKFINKAFSDRLELPKKEAINKSCYDILQCPNCKKTPGDCFINYDSEKFRVEFEDVYIEDHLQGWFNISHSPIYDDEDHLLGFICTLHDITERKNAEEALKKSEEKYRHLVRYAPSGIYEIDFINNKFVHVNDVMCIKSGYTKEELLNEITPFDLLTFEGQEYFKERLVKLFKGDGVLENVEFEIVKKAGTKFWVVLHVQYKYDKDDAIIGALVVSHDIDDRKRVELTLQKNEALMKSIFKAVPAGIGLINLDRTINWSNAKLREMTGYSEEELKNKSVRMLYQDDDEYNFVGEARYEQIMEEGVGNIETVWKRKDGRLIKILLSSSPIDFQDWSKGITFTALDITNL